MEHCHQLSCRNPEHIESIWTINQFLQIIIHQNNINFLDELQINFQQTEVTLQLFNTQK